jgi:3-deoxy-D-manno-octulosonic acid kinase
MRLQRIPTEGGAILYDPSRLAHPDDRDFDPVALANAGHVESAARGRGASFRVQGSDPGRSACYLRQYRRGGLFGAVLFDRYLWLGEQRTRAFRELALLSEMEALGLPAARGVAARYRRSGLIYRAELLTVAIEGARPLSSVWQELDAATWQRIGATVRRFHEAGIRHADLNAHNILVDQGGGVHLIDFDRGARVAPGRWRARNLARLARSLTKVAGSTVESAEWRALLEGYALPLAAPPR